ncbi:MAG: zinc-dependent metalloprotease, partial [Lewinella sp.]|nr:zinc-dependent metalloprotease [Lewinella sp.]
TIQTADDIATATARTAANKAIANEGFVRTRDVEYVPVTFHLVGRNDGTGRISEHKVMDQLCALNEDFAPVGIQFYLRNGTFNYVNNTTIYDNHLAAVNGPMFFAKDNRSVNIWIPNSADTNPDDQSVTLGYFDSSRDWLVVSKNEIGGPNSTLSHEMGHFLSLLHPFNGWDGVYFLEENTPADATSPYGVPTELADGSNCTTAGDMICDTPADYGNGFGWTQCEFTLNVLDPVGQPIDPDEVNWMTYFLLCDVDDYHFSDEQAELMMIDLTMNNDRTYLRQLPDPTVEIIEEAPQLISPIDAVTVPGYNEVLLEWSYVPGAQAYLLEIARTANFTVSPQRQIVYGTSVIVDNLDANRTYYWRVRPFNPLYTCDNESLVESFKTDATTATVEPPAVIDWQISPNPVRQGHDIAINLQTVEQLETVITLTDLTGRQVQAPRQHTFTVGDNQLNLPVETLANGLYVLRIQTATGQLTEKLVIAN